MKRVISVLLSLTILLTTVTQANFSAMANTNAAPNETHRQLGYEIINQVSQIAKYIDPNRPNLDFQTLIGEKSLDLVNSLSDKRISNIVPNCGAMGYFKYEYLNIENPYNNRYRGGGIDFCALNYACRTIDNAIIDEGMVGAPKEQSLIDLNNYAKSTLPKLDELIKLYDTNEIKFDKNAIIGSQDFQDSMGILMGWFDAITMANQNTDPTTWTLSLIRNTTIDNNGDSTRVEDLPVADIQAFVDMLNIMLEEAQMNVYVRTVSEAIFYGICQYMIPAQNGEITFLDTLRSLSLISFSDVKVSVKPYNPNLVNEFDIYDYDSVLKSVYPLDLYLSDNNITMGEYNSSPELKEQIDHNYQKNIYSILTKCVYDKFQPGVNDAFKRDFYSSYYIDECIGLLRLLKPSINIYNEFFNASITDQQLLEMSEVASREYWSNPSRLFAYLDSANCVLSPEGKAAFRTLSTDDTNNFIYGLVTLGNAAPQDKQLELSNLKAIQSTDNLSKLGEMTLVERLNYIIPAMMCVNLYGKENNYVDSVEGYFPNTDSIFDSIYIAKNTSDYLVSIGKEYHFDNFKTVMFEGMPITFEGIIAVEAANIFLNNFMDSIFSPHAPIDVNSTLNAFLTTKIDFRSQLTDIWKKLYVDFNVTVLELLPSAFVLLDEAIIPLLFTENDTYSASMNSLITTQLFDVNNSSMGAPLYKFLLSPDNPNGNIILGTNVDGGKILTFDLNKIAPVLFNYALDNTNSPYLKDLQFYGKLNPENNQAVPIIFNIFMLDCQVSKFKLGDPFINSICNRMENILAHSNVTVVPEMRDKTLEIARNVNDTVYSIVWELGKYVENYISSGRNQETRYLKDTQDCVILQRGLNNLPVVLPELIDVACDGFDRQFNQQSDYNYNRPGKIQSYAVDETHSNLGSKALEDFKKIALNPNVGKACMALGEFTYTDMLPVYRYLYTAFNGYNHSQNPNCKYDYSVNSYITMSNDIYLNDIVNDNNEYLTYNDYFNISLDKIIDTVFGHEALAIPDIKSTCSREGRIGGKYCPLCCEVIEMPISSPMLPHTEIIDPRVEPTCNRTGLTQGSHCSVCGEIIVPQTEIPRLEQHDFAHEEVQPTCTAMGYVKHVCRSCGYSYIDTYRDMLPHNYQKTVVDSTPNAKGYTRYECACGYAYISDFTGYASDNTVLKVAYNNANNVKPSDCSNESYTKLKSACDKNTKLVNENAPQTEIDNATTEILTALYDLQSYYDLEISAENGNALVSYNDVTNSTQNKHSILSDTNVTLNAVANEGFKFVGWYETNSKRIFSTNENYTFNILTNLSFEAKFEKIGTSTLTFTNRTGQIVTKINNTIDYWNKLTTIINILPDVPFSYGTTNGRWVYDEAQVLAALRNGENVTIMPEYDVADETRPTPPVATDEPVIDLYFKHNEQEKIGSFIMAYDIPADCKVESKGIAFYYGKATEYNPSEFILTLNNKLQVSQFLDSNKDNINIVNVNNFRNDYSWSGRAYITYRDAQGNLKTVYSNQINVVNGNQV